MNLGEFGKLGMTLREDFQSPFMTFRNGFESTVPPSISKGATFTGTEFLDIPPTNANKIFYHDELTVMIKFTFDFTPGDGTARYLYDSIFSDGKRSYVVILANGDLYFVHNDLTMKLVLLASYAPYLKEKDNIIFVSYKTLDNNFWINGVSLGSSATVYSKNITTLSVLGSRYSHNSFFNGTISAFHVWKRAFIATDVASYFSMGRDLNAGNARACFPYEKAYRRTSDDLLVTNYIGKNQGEAILGTGAVGVTSSPTKIAPFGMDFENSTQQYINCGPGDLFAFGDGVDDFSSTVLCLVKPESTASYYGLIAKGSGATLDYLFRYESSTTSIYLNTDSTNYLRVFNNLPANYVGLKRSHCFTYSASKTIAGLKLFTDGKEERISPGLVGTYTGSTNKGANATIGQYASGFFDGIMTRMWIFDRELSPIEVAVISERLSREASV